MRVKSLHSGVTMEQVRDQTGFEMLCEGMPPVTRVATEVELKILRETVDSEGTLAKKFPWH